MSLVTLEQSILAEIDAASDEALIASKRVNSLSSALRNSFRR